MKFFHHNLLVELNDDWWAEANMITLLPEVQILPGRIARTHLPDFWFWRYAMGQRAVKNTVGQPLHGGNVPQIRASALKLCGGVQ